MIVVGRYARGTINPFHAGPFILKTSMASGTRGSRSPFPCLFRSRRRRPGECR
jgi:hypothetical protein